MQMKEYKKSVIPLIESNIDNLTNVERIVAYFFINNKLEMDFSAKKIAGQLAVSEAALSRFAKKIGFSGYREFIFQYKKTFTANDEIVEDYVKEAFNTYEEQLGYCYSLIDSQQIKRITGLLAAKKRIYVYGMGSSGLAAQEFKIRFMRLGLDVEAITDAHLLAMNAVRVDQNCVVFGITISGNTKEVLKALEKAKEKSALTILVTSKQNPFFRDMFDELVLLSVKKNLEYGNMISPQFPILIIMDVLYASYLRNDQQKSEEVYESTLYAILDRNT